MSEYIEYILLPDERIEEALKVQQDSMRQEILALGIGLYDKTDSAEMMKLVFREVVKDRCTMIAVDSRSQQIVAVCFNKIHVPLRSGQPDPLGEFVENNIQDEACRGIIDFLADVESKVNIFENYKASRLLEIFYVGTDPRFGDRGIGSNMVKASIELGRRLGKEVIFGIFTSNFSQRIASRFEFEWLATTFYDEYIHRGKKLSEKIGSFHKTAKLGALKIVH